MALWLERAQKLVTDNYTRLYQNVQPPVLEAGDRGVKYVRIVSRDLKAKTGSAFAFVEIATGDVLKPDGWKRPAKGKRGNIYDTEALGVGMNGAHYANRGRS